MSLHEIVFKSAMLRNWAGSVALPIPRNLVVMLNLEAGKVVDIDVQDGKIIIQAARSKYSLEQLRAEHKALKLPNVPAGLDFEDLSSERISSLQAQRWATARRCLAV